MTLPIRNFQELEDRLDELGYTKKTANQIRPEIRRAAKIYKQPLLRIAVDPADFENRWGRGRISAIAEGFDSHDQFLNFRKRLRPALQRAAGVQLRSSVALPPASRELLGFVKVNGGVGRRVPPHLEDSIGALARAAARLGLSVADVDATAIDRIFSDLKGAERRSARRGVQRVNDLIADLDRLPELIGVLPEIALPDPAPKVSASCGWRRGTSLAESQRLWREFDRFVVEKRGVDALGRPIPPEHSKFGIATEKSYAHNLNLALTELVRRGDLGPGMAPSLRDICNHQTIEKVAGYWNVRQLDGEVKHEASTLHTLVCRLSHIATHLGAKRKEAKKLAKLRKDVREACGTVGQMKVEHVEWIKSFARNPALQRAVFDLPEALMRKANALLAKWPQLKKQRRKKLMMDALRMGIAACAAAILFRASPIRAANLRKLRFRGDDAHLRPDAREDMRIVIPGEETKNGNAIDHAADEDAWPVVEWYLKHIRPKLIGDHPYLRKSKQPLVDSDYLFPSTRMDRGLEETAFAAHYTRGCELAGVDLTLHLARHITVYLILSQDPNAWAQAAAVLEDNIDTVKKHYAWLDKEKASQAGRDLMKQSRAKVRKHKKGTYHAV
jgi:hypothetical protein